MTDLNGCEVATEPVEVIVSAVSDVNGQLNIVFYPNPAYDKVTVIAEEGYIGVDIMSADGRTIQRYINSNQLDVSMLSAGTYFLRFLMDYGYSYGFLQVIHD